MYIVHIKFSHVFLSYFLLEHPQFFFFSFKFLKNIHLELIEYFPMFCLITRNYVSKSFGKKCVLVAQSCPNSL